MRHSGDPVCRFSKEAFYRPKMAIMKKWEEMPNYTKEFYLDK
jgi:hypothetical protein